MNGERQMGRRTRDVGVEKGLWSARRMGMVAFRCFDPEKRTSSQCLGAIRKRMAPKVENRGLCFLGRIINPQREPTGALARKVGGFHQNQNNQPDSASSSASALTHPDEPSAAGRRRARFAPRRR